MNKQKSQAEQVLALLRTPADLNGAGERELLAFTPDRLAHALGVLPTSIHRTLRRLREMDLAHVHLWLRKYGVSVWASGEGRDAVRPKMSADEKRALQKGYYQTWSRTRKDKVETRGDLIQTPMRELGRTEATIERAKATPRSWFSQLEDATEPQP